MALTENMSMNLINSSDYVTPDIINDNFEILDKLGVDYVVEQGVSGSWSYRKFKSGIAECWAKISFPATTATGQLQSGFTFPFVFSQEPVVSVCGGVDNRSDSHISYVNCHGGGTIVDCYIYKGTNGNYARWVYCHAIGRVD